jgi:hypothetical protein
MQEQKELQEICIQQHRELENREASLELQELQQNHCKICGDMEYKFYMCQNCYNLHKSDIISKVGFVGGWILGSFVIFSFTTNSALICSFGIAIGNTICNLSKMKF